MRKQTDREYSNSVKLQIPSSPKYASLARNLVFQAARNEGFGFYEAADLKLIVGEAIQYVIQYAYGNRDNFPVFIECNFKKDRMEIRIRDYGVKMDEEQLSSVNLSDYRVSGLGMYMIKQLADHFYLDKSSGNGNLMIIMKKK